MTALTTPKLMMKDVTATVEASWKVSLPISGTKRPFQPDHTADEGVDEHQQRELLPVLAQPERNAGSRRCPCIRRANHGGLFRRSRPQSGIPGPYLCRLWRRGRDVLQHEIDELALCVDPERRVVTALEPDS